MASFPIESVLGIQVPNLHVVDVGASMVEGADHYAPLVDRGLCRVTGFEPDPAQYQALQDSGRERYSYLPYALGDGRPGTFHVTRHPGCSSLLSPNGRFIDKFTVIGARPPHGNFAVVDTVQMQTRRLDDIVEIEAIDYMKLDIQGAEVSVLRNGVQKLRDVLVLESEVLFVPLYDGQGDFAELTTLLKQQGFMLLELRDIRKCSLAPFLAGGQSFVPCGGIEAPFGQWMWADAIYVRSYQDLDTWDTGNLLKAAVVLHEVYDAYDLVHHLLVEYQNRSMVPVAKRYRQAVARSPDVAHRFPIVQAAFNKVAELA